MASRNDPSEDTTPRSPSSYLDINSYLSLGQVNQAKGSLTEDPIPDALWQTLNLPDCRIGESKATLKGFAEKVKIFIPVQKRFLREDQQCLVLIWKINSRLD